MPPHLPDSLHAFALTQRGHGDASRPAAGYRLEDFAGDVESFMDAVGLESAMLVGHSMGGAIAQRFAIDRPERVRGLVLLGAFATLRGNARKAGGRDGRGARRPDRSRVRPRLPAQHRRAEFPTPRGGRRRGQVPARVADTLPLIEVDLTLCSADRRADAPPLRRHRRDVDAAQQARLAVGSQAPSCACTSVATRGH
jgi:pimeloyl-ACP methyl ester carboxylesterase